jgi:hypothetical protein
MYVVGPGRARCSQGKRRVLEKMLVEDYLRRATSPLMTSKYSELAAASHPPCSHEGRIQLHFTTRLP